MQSLSNGHWKRSSRNGLSLKKISEALSLTLGLSASLPRWRDISGALDRTLPLLVFCDQRMAKEKQEKLIRFVQEGGKLLLTPVIPDCDEAFHPCTLLRDFLGVTDSVFLSDDGPLTLKTGEKVFGAQQKFTFPGFHGVRLGTNDSDGLPLIEYKQIGKGAVVLLGVAYDYCQFCQMDMLLSCLSALGFEKRIVTDCKTLIATLYEDGKRARCFLMNEFSGSVNATLTVRANQKTYRLENITVPALSVLPIELD